MDPAALARVDRATVRSMSGRGPRRSRSAASSARRRSPSRSATPTAPRRSVRNSAASSSASRVARSSEAGTPRVVSKRMSSGPPVRKPKPRSRSASWNEDRPRSNSIPSTAPKPAAGATSASCRKFAGAGRAGRRTAARRMATRSIAAWSASSPRTRPSGLAASRIRSVCPPPPTVASIWRLPGAGTGSRGPRPASPAGALPPSLLHRSVADPERTLEAHVVRRQIPRPAIASVKASPSRRLAVGLPAAGCPHLGVIAGAEDQRLVLEAGEAAQVPRDEDPTLAGRAPSRRRRRTAVAAGAVRSGRSWAGRRPSPPARPTPPSERSRGRCRATARRRRSRRAARGSATGRRAVPCRRPHAGTRR